MEVLVYLAEHPGEVLSREELARVVWSGTHVTTDALTYCICTLRKTFQDNARNPHIIQTISRRGYRLMAPVTRLAQARSGDADGAAAILPDVARQRAWWRMHTGLLGAAVIPALLVVTALAHLISSLLPWSEHGYPHGGTVLAILPFDNLGGDAGQELFSDGLTEEMITRLSRLGSSGLRVIAQTSVRQYKGTKKRIDQIGRELGADYILEGAIRGDGKSLRITAQLIRASDQADLWSQSYDCELSGILGVQGELAGVICKQIRLALALG